MIKVFTHKLFQALVFFIIFILFFLFVFIPSLKKINTDFPNYYVSANMLLDSKNLEDAYDNVQFNKQVLLYGIENQFVSFVPYPPVNALILIPLARLAPLTAKLFWNIFNLFLFFGSIYFISRISKLNFFLTGIIFFVSGYAFVNNFFFGQVYLLILFLFSASLYCLFREKGDLAALLISISILLKFYTGFFLLLFLIRKQFRLFFVALFFILIFNFIAFAITGWDVNLFYYSRIMPRISDGWVGIVYASEFQSVSSLLHNLFYREPSLNPNPLIESPQLYFILKYVFNFGILISSVYSVFLTSSVKSSAIFKIQISLFCFVCMLLLPVNASYQYVILIPSVAILTNFYITENKYYHAGLLLSLFFLINSPVAIYVINLTKGGPLFFLGYIKLYVLIALWIANLNILRTFGRVNVSFNPLLRYSFVYIILILIFTNMSLAVNKPETDSAVNILRDPDYMISMPNSYKGKLIFSECYNDKFVLNSNFGLKFDKENILEPEFLNDSEIVYETIIEKKKIFKKLNFINFKDTIISNPKEIRILFDSMPVKSYVENGQIYLEDSSRRDTIPVTNGNALNILPFIDYDENKIIFCSDRNRGVGFTTLYEVKIKR